MNKVIFLSLILFISCKKSEKDYIGRYEGEYRIEYTYYWEQYNNPDPPYYFSKDTAISYTGSLYQVDGYSDRIALEFPDGTPWNFTISEKGTLSLCDSVGNFILNNFYIRFTDDYCNTGTNGSFSLTTLRGSKIN